VPARTPPKLRLTLFDHLSHLTYAKACRLLGPDAKALLARGGALEIDVESQIERSVDRFSLDLGVARVALALDDDGPGLRAVCDRCGQRADPARCEHVAAALALVLEEKMLLGLAAPPPERVPVGALAESEVTLRALADRTERAKTEKMRVHSEHPKRLWTDYAVTSAASGRTYKVALRGSARGESYCSCPDFRTNTLGTCKHILNVEQKVRKRFSATQRARPYRRRRYALYIAYGERAALRLAVPDEPLSAEAAKVVRPLIDRPIEDLPGLVRRLGRLERLGVDVHVHPDAAEWIDRGLSCAHIEQLVREIRANPRRHPLRRALLDVELLPYQLDGIAFAVGAGRAILADDMGLGKTIQGVGVAELLRRELGIARVLIVCPASLKAQWRGEIERFSGHRAQLVVGDAEARARQYASDTFFTICNYEQVIRDVRAIERVAWDLIILDEAQRIKNWEARTSRIVKSLRSRFALALSGTPIENRLDELYSIVEFIDERLLGPAFRFFNRHRRTNERGAVLGYEELGTLRKALEPIFLRRTRELVMDELPPRTSELVRVSPTPEQEDLHAAHMQTVVRISRKRYISEMDLLRLQKALLMCRMAADATALVDKIHPGHSSKLERLDALLADLLEEDDRKIVVFSEWTSMLDMIEERLETRCRVPQKKKGAKRGPRSRQSAPRPGLEATRWVRLDGQVPQKARQALVDRFQTDPDTRIFLASNAGSTGLNLQAANTIVNVDLPWNPAVLEQRIGRAHRMGQKRPVQVYLLVTEQTIEENLLATLSAKQDLSNAVLDPDSEVEAVDMVTGVEQLRERLEVLLGAKPVHVLDAGPSDGASTERRARVARAGGELLAAAFRFLDDVVVVEDADTRKSEELGRMIRKQLAECVAADAEGRPTLTVTLPDERAIDALAGTLGRILGRK
jgi:superfamily II DNA or RNA helicase